MQKYKHPPLRVRLQVLADRIESKLSRIVIPEWVVLSGCTFGIILIITLAVML